MNTIPKLIPRFKELTPQTKWKLRLFYLRDHISPRTWRKIILSFFILLGMSVYLYHISLMQKEKQAHILGVVQTVEGKYNEGMALIDTHPDQAQLLLKEAQDLVFSVSSSTLDQQNIASIDMWKQKIQDGLTFSQKKYTVMPDVFLELPLIGPSAQGSQIFLHQDTLLVWDASHKGLYRINMVSKAARVISGGEKVREVVDIVPYGEEIYVLEPEGIGRLDVQGNVQPVIAKDDEWKETSFLRVFSGNLYILDKGAGQLWKYSPAETGFEGRQEYFLYDTVVDLHQATDIAINGHVFLVKNNQIVRFTQGIEDYWEIKGIESSLGNMLSLFSDELSEHLYILDHENSRIVVTDMMGMYVAEYSYPAELDIKDIVVSEILKKIVLLSPKTIYTIPLQ